MQFFLELYLIQYLQFHHTFISSVFSKQQPKIYYFFRINRTAYIFYYVTVFFVVFFLQSTLECANTITWWDRDKGSGKKSEFKFHNPTSHGIRWRRIIMSVDSYSQYCLKFFSAIDFLWYTFFPSFFNLPPSPLAWILYLNFPSQRLQYVSNKFSKLFFSSWLHVRLVTIFDSELFQENEKLEAQIIFQKAERNKALCNLVSISISKIQHMYQNAYVSEYHLKKKPMISR